MNTKMFFLKAIAMSSVKESLRDTIEGLSEEEAYQILEFVQRLRKKDDVSPTLKRLANDPTFKLPSERAGGFRIVHPIQGKGTPASRLLVEDRR
jgi:hypothetical protein